MAGEATGSAVRILNPDRKPAQTTPDPLLAVMQAASDRSSRSDELAAHITDWDSRNHLSRLRANLLLPLRLTQGQRVLEIGCSTGSLTRELAEKGATVTGLEPSLGQALVAAARCIELTNTDIVCGSLAEYSAEGHEGEFDLILLVGALERSGKDPSFGESAERLLSQALGMLSPLGVIAIAAENQLGLKYILGYPENNRGIPWIGIDGYRSGHNPSRTWSRRELGRMLTELGLPEQEWLFPYPGYSLPTAVARSSIYESQEGIDLVRQFVRSPLDSGATSSMLTADPLSAFNTVLRAGLGPDTANAFLIVCGRSGADPASRTGEGSLWLSSPERPRELADARVLVGSQSAWGLKPIRDRRDVYRPPLLSRRSDLPVVVGSNLEDEIVALAARSESPWDLKPLLDEWWAAARGRITPSEVGDGGEIDVMPRNYVRTPVGDLVFIDSEWTWTEPVHNSWPLLRSCWYLIAERLWPAGAMAGFSWNLTLGDAALGLARLVEPTVSTQEIEAAIQSEALLQAIISGGDAQESLRHQREQLARPLIQLGERPPLAQIIEHPLSIEQAADERVRAARLVALVARDEAAGTLARVTSLQAEVADLNSKLLWLRRRSLMHQTARARSLAGRVKRMVKP